MKNILSYFFKTIGIDNLIQIFYIPKILLTVLFIRKFF